MRVLVAHASKRGGTAGIAEIIGNRLRDRGLEVEIRPASATRGLESYEAFVVGSALYGGRWRRDAVKLLQRLSALDTPLRVFLFQSGPLGDDEADTPQPLPKKVANLASRLDGGHAETFGGRLHPDAKGWLASRMAKTMSGDWRDHEVINEWADRVAGRLIPEDSTA